MESLFTNMNYMNFWKFSQQRNRISNISTNTCWAEKVNDCVFYLHCPLTHLRLVPIWRLRLDVACNTLCRLLNIRLSLCLCLSLSTLWYTRIPKLSNQSDEACSPFYSISILFFFTLIFISKPKEFSWITLLKCSVYITKISQISS